MCKLGTMTELLMLENKFSGKVPATYANCSSLIRFRVNNNSLSGVVPAGIWSLPNLNLVDLTSNRFSGDISQSFGTHPNFHNLYGLDASGNQFTGTLPTNWTESKNLVYLNLPENKITGEIPETMFPYMTSLRSLHLNNNNFTGKFPSSLRYCKNLTVLDLGDNRFHGNIPPWLGRRFPSLKVLRLRSNYFSGSIPPKLSLLASLRHLDLANNDLIGSIPHEFGHFASMAIKTQQRTSLDYRSEYSESISITWKGEERVFQSTLSLVVGIDLSNNFLVHEIPNEMTSLHGLVFFNLSRNYLSGNIPSSVGDLRLLESMDLSMNRLSGTIPPSISSLTFLSNLNLSYNNLSGRIPSGNELQTLTDPSIYIGNDGLCGASLKSCPDNDDDDGKLRTDGSENEHSNDTLWLYLGMRLGFVFGSWGFWGVLLFRKSWRFAYFRFVDDFQVELCDKFRLQRA